MKRLIAVILATVMSATLFVACGETESGGSYSYEQIMAKFEGEPEQNVTIKVLENDIAVDEGYFDDLITAFNAEYAEYGIKAEDANMSQYTDLEKNGPLGYGPDVLYDANDKIMRYAENGHVLPLPTEKLDVYGEGNLETSVSDTYKMNKYGMDLQFGVPINVQTLVIGFHRVFLRIIFCLFGSGAVASGEIGVEDIDRGVIRKSTTKKKLLRTDTE